MPIFKRRVNKLLVHKGNNKDISIFQETIIRVLKKKVE